MSLLGDFVSNRQVGPAWSRGRLLLGIVVMWTLGVVGIVVLVWGNI